MKSVLENELIDNQIDFLYSSYVTNVLTDSNGKKSGVVIANRSVVRPFDVKHLSMPRA